MLFTIGGTLYAPLIYFLRISWSTGRNSALRKELEPSVLYIVGVYVRNERINSLIVKFKTYEMLLAPLIWCIY